VKILVTGAAGFIGFHLSQKLLALGNEVVGLDALTSYYDPALKQTRLDILIEQPGFRFGKIDLTDAGELEDFVGAGGPISFITSVPSRASATALKTRKAMSSPILSVRQTCSPW